MSLGRFRPVAGLARGIYISTPKPPNRWRWLTAKFDKSFTHAVKSNMTKTSREGLCFCFCCCSQGKQPERWHFGNCDIQKVVLRCMQMLETASVRARAARCNENGTAKANKSEINLNWRCLAGSNRSNPRSIPACMRRTQCHLRRCGCHDDDDDDKRLQY